MWYEGNSVTLQGVQLEPSYSGSLLLGAVIFWVTLSLEKGSRGDGEVFISSGHCHLVTLSLWFNSSFLHSHWVFDFQWQGFVHPWDEIQAFPWLFEAATPHVYLASSLLHVCPSALLTLAALLTVLSAQVCCTFCPQAHCPSPVSPLCLTQVLTSQESFPSMSRLSPCSPPAAFHCDVFRISADTVRCLLWWRDGVTGGWAMMTSGSTLTH